ncbi:MAG TPA: DMT family transporter [Phycisphaerales bacterium]|nr:DMT family transporter [Phycisphaerales bacterium]
MAATAPETFASRWTGVASVLMALVGWSSIPLFLKHFAGLIDPWTSNGWRYAFSALFWSPVIVIGLARRSLPPGIWRAALWPSLINCAAQVVFCLAHYKIDPGLLAFGLRSNIVFTTVGAAIMFASERRVIRSPGFMLGVMLVIAGTTGTILLGEGVPAGSTLTGVVLAISAGAGFAAYALAVRRCMHGVNAIQSFAVISLYTAAGMVALMLVYGREAGLGALGLVGRPLGDAPAVPILFDQFGMLLLSSLIGIALGHVAYYYAIARLGVAVSSGVVQLQPFFVSLGSLALFGEELTPLQWGSGGIAVSGATLILVVQHFLHRQGPPEASAPGRADFAELPPDHVAAATASERDRAGLAPGADARAEGSGHAD